MKDITYKKHLKKFTMDQLASYHRFFKNTSSGSHFASKILEEIRERKIKELGI